MRDLLRNLTSNFFRMLNMGITSYDELQRLIEFEKDCDVLMSLPKADIIKIVSLLEKSKSQIKQDLFVLTELGFKERGFFVEFGATNGIGHSNTYLLEKEFKWNGILAEPAKGWHEELSLNRSCNIEHNFVWRDSHSTLSFNEFEERELSTIYSFNDSDKHRKSRKNGKAYDVSSISLVDLLDKYNAPKIIDYLSVDTEGSEYEILSHFDFKKYSFKVITCEHNHTKYRRKIYELLTANGYTRKHIGFSKWDDWYVND